MYKCAILGCRGRARGHARAYQHVKRGKIVAICDLKEELLKDFGEQFGIEKRYTDIHEMLDKEPLDGIVASQPFDRHGILVPQLLKGGVPIFTEKPLAASVAVGRDSVVPL